MASASISLRGKIEPASMVYRLPSSLNEIEPRVSAASYLIRHSDEAKCLFNLERTGVFKMYGVAISPSRRMQRSYKMRIRISVSFSTTSFSTRTLRISASITD